MCSRIAQSANWMTGGSNYPESFPDKVRNFCLFNFLSFDSDTRESWVSKDPSSVVEVVEM